MATVPFDFMIHTGDIAYGGGTRAAFEGNFFRIYADYLKYFPVFPASGNHEYDSDDAAPFREVFVLPENGGPEGIERWYSYDWGDVHFVALDLERTGPVQAAWLDADLTANQPDHRLLAQAPVLVGRPMERWRSNEFSPADREVQGPARDQRPRSQL